MAAEEGRNMNNKILTIGIALFIATVIHTDVFAEDMKESRSTATIAKEEQLVDRRAEKLEQYLKSKNSPMASSARHMISEADRLGLDWKLVAAISGNESYFGQLIPYNSFNAWGWAVYTGQSYGANFDNWEHGVTTVSEGLKENYINDGLTTVEQIGRRYAADRAWSVKVQHFMDEIDAFDPNLVFNINDEFPEQFKTLALSL